VSLQLQKGLPLLAILGVEHLCGAFLDKGLATRAPGFAVGAILQPLNVEIEEFYAVTAVAQLILRVHVMATPGADESATSFRVIDVEPVATHPAFVYPDVTITIVDHIHGTALVAHHLITPLYSTGARVRMLSSLTVLLIGSGAFTLPFHLPSFSSYLFDAAQS